MPNVRFNLLVYARIFFICFWGRPGTATSCPCVFLLVRTGREGWLPSRARPLEPLSTATRTVGAGGAVAPVLWVIAAAIVNWPTFLGSIVLPASCQVCHVSVCRGVRCQPGRRQLGASKPLGCVTGCGQHVSPTLRLPMDLSRMAPIFSLSFSLRTRIF